MATRMHPLFVLVIALAALGAARGAPTAHVRAVGPYLSGFEGSVLMYRGEPGTTFNVLCTPGILVNAHVAPAPNPEGNPYIDAVGVSSILRQSVGHFEVTIDPSGSGAAAYLEGMKLNIKDTPLPIPIGLDVIEVHVLQDGSIEVDVPGVSVIARVPTGAGHVDLPAVKLTGSAPPHEAETINGFLGQTAIAGSSDFQDDPADYQVSDLWSWDFTHNIFDPPLPEQQTKPRKHLSQPM